ncbi:hypothetical protein [Yersinia sp. 1652 StPb PI]
MTKKDITEFAKAVMNVENINQDALVKTINKLGGLASVKKTSQ